MVEKEEGRGKKKKKGKKRNGKRREDGIHKYGLVHEPCYPRKRKL
jgi:hypothetical protein